MNITTTTTNNNNNNCSFPPMFSPPSFSIADAPCGGHGTCLLSPSSSSSNGISYECVCDAGWRNRGDLFSNQFTVYCGFHDVTLQTLWGIVVILHTFMFIYSVLFLRARFKETTTSTTINSGITSSPTCCWLFHPYSDAKLLGILTCQCSFCFIIVGIIRCVDLNRTVGSDVLVTIFFSLAGTPFWFSSILTNVSFFRAIMPMAKFSDKEMSWFKRLRQEMIGAALLISPSSMFSPLIMIGFPNETDAFILGLIHHGGLAIVMAIVGMIIIPKSANSLNSLLDTALSHEQNELSMELMKTIQKKTNEYRMKTKMNALINLIIAALLGFWPFLQIAGTSYWYPFAWSFFACLQLYNQLVMTTPVKKNVNAMAISGMKSNSRQESNNNNNQHISTSSSSLAVAVSNGISPRFSSNNTGNNNQSSMTSPSSGLNNNNNNSKI
jgi:hypothetical protein